MGRFYSWLIVTCVCLGVLSGPASAASAFFQTAPPEGWFWYSLPPEPPKVDKPKPPKPAPPVAMTPAPPAHPTSPTGPAPYSSAWLRKYLPKYRERAIDTPSRRNVLAYMYLQRLTMDKSQRFAQAVQAAVKTTPFLDETTRRPISALGSRLADLRADRARKAVLQELSDRFGLWYFYSGARACAYCASQASILSDVHEIYGFHVTAISMDGAMPAMRFADIKMDQGQAEQLGINTPLGLVLVNPANREIIPLAHGLLVRSQIMERILLAAHTAGWISDEMYNRTLPVSQKNLLTAKALRPAQSVAARDTAPSGSLPINPGAVVSRMQNAVAAQRRTGGF